MHAEASIQRLKANGCMRCFGRWEFAPFEMQIPQRAERAGETGALGSVLPCG